MVGTLGAELRKALGLPGVVVGAALAVVVPVGIAALSAFSLRSALDSGRAATLADPSTVDSGFGELGLGVVGAAILGVVIVSSEYTANRVKAGGGRQVSTTLTAMPHRLRVLAAKLAVLTALVVVLAAVAVPLTLAVSGFLLGDHAQPYGDHPARAVGAGLYWLLTAWLAFGITLLTRSGIVPLVVIVANASLVSVTYLLARSVPAARFLPDVAGAQMFAREYHAPDMLDPVTGGLVMAAWAVALLAVAGTVFVRRDA
ncbi:hypothetical protein [Polymorphospora sp. NPDC050346]|uniref:hypothetical protein n=1 Tax=Polymorphospora sp. NPDC050346 TaxID=3155780 RepID=UPI0033FA7AD4